MITFEPIIIPNNKRKDGTYPVKIRIYFNGKSRRLPTTWVCQSSDLTRTKKGTLKIKKDAGVRDKARELIKKMRKVTDNYVMAELEGRDVDWLVRKIKDGMREEKFSLDFFEWADRYILTKKDETRRAYIRALNTFERFLGERVLDINDINKMMLLELRIHLLMQLRNAVSLMRLILLQHSIMHILTHSLLLELVLKTVSLLNVDVS